MDLDLDNLAGIAGDFSHHLGIAAADYPFYPATPGGPDNSGKIYVAAHGLASHYQLTLPIQLHRCFVSLLFEFAHGNMFVIKKTGPSDILRRFCRCMHLAPCSDMLSLRYLFDDLPIRVRGLLRSPNRAGKS